MKIRILVAAAGAILMLSAPVLAQSTTISAATGTSMRTFDSLSPGNQKIANALFSAQDTTGTTRTPLTKDQIAGLRGTEGWGRVFKQMKADGLIRAKNLGQVVSAHQHELNAARRGGTASATTTARTGRGGRSTMMASARTHRRFGAAGFTGERGFAGGTHRMGGGVAVSTMGSGGFGHGGMGGGVGGGFGHGGMGGGMAGGFGGGGHGGGRGR
jgi:hypothetical protein